ncbi:MAG: FAD-dependent oxidoreductase [bacterium]|nr:FAD-dependent oxidoreductase [bacterium]
MVYDLIIIGGGPAGITAGIYGARKVLKTLLLTKDFVGQIGRTDSIENYPGFLEIGGIDLSKKFREHLKKFSIEIKEGSEVKSLSKPDRVFKVETTKGEAFEAKTVVVASGRNPRPLKVPGEQRLEGRGVSFCGTCDAPFFKGKTVAVVGGGNAALETVLDLLPFATEIYVLEISSRLAADEINQQRVGESGKAEIILRAQVLEIKGENAVEKLVYRDLTNNQEKELTAQGVFIEIGSLPATDFLKDLVDFNKAGEIAIDPLTCATKTPGLFAAGDVTDIKYKQIVVAAGEGAKAALSAYNYLQNP